ncbi:two-partner secretion domain-containing protein [Phaeovulum sp. W22_SRMD_FR3]|uniref:two-partner secretion domain-containing protein n=1 Tax=Phaeovulum sp. W22_SRMD_FR3 TaxID=3240274 RepID=UPI003F9DC4E7
MGAPTAARAQALPEGATVAAGSASISTGAPGSMVITQGTDTAVINWNSFSIGSGGTVDIRQPDATAALLNRVTGDSTSTIYGSLTANGQVYLVNPNGIFIGPSGQVSTGGFVASTLDISDADFQAGRLRFGGTGQSAAVVNQGTISTLRGGYAALLGGSVDNAGVIRVPMGRVGLGAGEQVTLDLAGDGFLQVALPSESDDAATTALVRNSGTIIANGGQVELMAATARDAARQTINMSGVIEARSVGGQSGAIVLGGGSGGAVRISGRMDVSAAAPASSPTPPARPAVGGAITVTGADISLTGASLNASGAAGGGTIRIGGDARGEGDLPHAETVSMDATSSLRADALTNGDGGRIILWSDLLTDARGTFSARGGAEGGDGGFVEVSGHDDLRYFGRTDTRAPQGQTGMLLLDPVDYTLPGSSDAATIEANLATSDVTISTTGSGTDAGNITINEALSWTAFTALYFYADNNIVLNSPITGPAGGLYFSAPGTVTTGAAADIDVRWFYLAQGNWLQLGSTLPGLTATDFAVSSSANFLRALGGDGSAGDPYQLTDAYGLVALAGSLYTEADFVLANDIDASGTAGWDDTGEGALGFNPIGFFDGTLDGAGHAIDGLTEFDYATEGGLFNTLGSNAVITDLRMTNADLQFGNGGILAATNNGTIRNTSVSGSVVGDQGSALGGMVGTNTGSITDSFSTATVDLTYADFYATELAVGGLAGINEGTITRSNATGTVSGDNFAGGVEMSVGGLVGANHAAGQITDSYAWGAVQATGDSLGAVLGGLTGTNAGTITRSIATGAVQGSGSASFTEGGLNGRDLSGTVTASYWDATASGQATSAGGTSLTTSALQDTAGFRTLATSAGWDFGGVWAPGANGYYPVNYSTTPVVFALPDNLTLQYGTVESAVATGSVSGGSSAYVFDDPTDTMTPTDLLADLTFASNTVGTSSFGVTATTATSTQGQAFRVVSLPATATITPAPLTVTAGDQVGVYGPGVALGGSAYSVDGLVYSDTVDSVLLDSSGAAPGAAVAGSPYAITPSGASGSGLSNYDITYVAGALVLTPAALTITALDQSGVYGPGFTLPGSGYSTGALAYSGDSVTAVTLSSAGAAPGAPVAGSPYVITPSGATGTGLSNYTITYVPGALTVTPAALTITALDQSGVYGPSRSLGSTGFTTSGLAYSGDSVDSVALASSGAAAGAPVAGSPYVISVSNASGTGLSNYDISYVSGALTLVAAPLTITALDQSRFEGDGFGFAGTEFSVTGLAYSGDLVSMVDLASDGAASDATADGSPYAITASDATGTGLGNYDITYVAGTMTVAAPTPDIAPPPPPVPSALPNPADTVNTTLVTPGSTVAVAPGVEPATETLVVVKSIATKLEIAARSCGQSDADIGRYLACLADSMDQFATSLDEISQDLPPGLGSVGDIIRGTRDDILNISATAEARLATATTDAERQAIRRDAVGAAHRSLQNAQSEIRKAISLIRAEDPELVSLQTATIETIVGAVASVDSGLSRVAEL